ncbi:MAG: alpha/beta hydrolase [Gammaproteobacteria bacterium]|nr:alpha/beta hydrolase [Gammaproteobacteria bacterium]
MDGFVQLSDELSIHYVAQGHGRPLIFIPGWTMTVEAFGRNIGPLSERFQAIAYDPRSQGRSSRVECGNHYTQHGQDLADFIRELGLSDVVLLGWSTGAFAAYAYFEQFGCANVSAFVSIDMPPRPIKDDEADWGIDSRENVRRMQASVTAPDHSALVRMMASHGFFMQPADESFVDAIVSRSLNTAPHIAALLLGDGNLCDYSQIARDVASQLPVLQIVNERASASATKWIEANTPTAELIPLGAHMMFWEYPEKFNGAVSRFLDTHLPA